MSGRGRTSRWPHGLALTLLVISVGCRGCGEERRSALDLVPESAPGWVHVPRAGALVSDARALVDALGVHGARDALDEVRQSLAAQLGLDPFDPDGLEAIGLAPDGEALLLQPKSGSPLLLALPTADIDRFDTNVRQLIERIDGANRFAISGSGPTALRTVGRPFGSRVVPVLAWGHAGGYAWMSSAHGQAALEEHQRWLRERLAKDPRASQTNGALPASLEATLPSPSLVVHAGRGSLLAKLGAAGVQLEALWPYDDEGPEPWIAAAPQDLLGRIDADAMIVGLSHQARPEVWTQLSRHPRLEALGRRLLDPLGRAAGIDGEAELVPLLDGALTLALHLGDASTLQQALRRGRVQRRRALDFVQISITARVRDADAMLTLLRRSQANLQGRGIEIVETVEQVAGKPAHLFSPKPSKAARVGWALWGNDYIYGAGPGRLRRTLEHLGAAGKETPRASLAGTPAERAAKLPGTSILLIRGGAIADHLAFLATSPGATQEGAATEALGALVSTALGVLRATGDVVATVTPSEHGLHLQLKQEMR